MAMLIHWILVLVCGYVVIDWSIYAVMPKVLFWRRAISVFVILMFTGFQALLTCGFWIRGFEDVNLIVIGASLKTLFEPVTGTATIPFYVPFFALIPIALGVAFGRSATLGRAIERNLKSGIN